MRVAGKGNYRTVSNNDRYRSTVVPLDDCGLREGIIKKNAANFCPVANWSGDRSAL